jgi:hypothetical protein
VALAIDPGVPLVVALGEIDLLTVTPSGGPDRTGSGEKVKAQLVDRNRPDLVGIELGEVGVKRRRPRDEGRAGRERLASTRF